MKKSGVRERVIEAASYLFYNNGYNQNGINQIIEEAQVAKASMYQHFRSKEDIAAVYLRQRHYKWMSDLDDFVASKETGKEKIIASFDFLDQWLVDVNFIGCGFQNIITDLPDDHKKIRDEVKFHKNELHQWIENLLEGDKTYSKKRIKELSNETMVVIEGAIILSQIQKAAWPIMSGKKTCIKILSEPGE